MKISSFFDCFDHLILSSNIKISDHELCKIFRNNKKKIYDVFVELKQHKNKELSIILHNKKKLKIILDSNIVHMYYVKGEKEKNKQFHKLLDNINLEISLEKKQEAMFINDILENGIS